MGFEGPQLTPESIQKAKQSSETIPQEDTLVVMEKEARSIKVQPEDKNEKGYLLAPNGSISYLPERQWKMVRTKKFKEFFGDWENPPVRQFKTAQGSVYEYDADGKTRRFKTATGEQQERQDLTVFVNLNTEEEQDFLEAYRSDDPNEKAKVYVIERGKDDKPNVLRDISQITDPDRVYLGIAKEGKLLKIKKASILPVVGYNSFDTRQFQKDGQTYTERHLGNKVVDIEYETSAISKAINENGEPLLLTDKDGSTAFVDMKHPYEMSQDDIAKWYKERDLVNNKKRFQKLMEYIESEGYDGLMVDGKPAQDSITGSYGCKSEQIIKIK